MNGRKKEEISDQKNITKEKSSTKVLLFFPLFLGNFLFTFIFKIMASFFLQREPVKWLSFVKKVRKEKMEKRIEKGVEAILKELEK